MASDNETTSQRVDELHRQALDIFPKLERIIDELKGLEPREKLNALPNIEDWLGQLSGRAHVQGSQFRYVRHAVERQGKERMKENPELTDRDHDNMDAFLGHVLKLYKAGEIAKEEAVGDLAHVMTALDQDNYGEVRSWLEQRHKFVRP